VKFAYCDKNANVSLGARHRNESLEKIFRVFHPRDATQGAHFFAREYCQQGPDFIINQA
jgi:hypothetical protein